MKIFFDTEFTGLHKGTTLISIGFVTEDGNTFYAECLDYAKKQCDRWITDNVISNLLYAGKSAISETKHSISMCSYKAIIANTLKDWLSRFDDIQLVSDCCHYDMVLFVDFFGSSFSLPPNISPVCHDINQDIMNYYDCTDFEAFNKSREKIIKEFGVQIDGVKHNSLYDALVIRAIYNHIYRII